MIIPGVTPAGVREIFGAPTEERRVVIDASSAYVTFLKNARVAQGIRFDLEEALHAWESVGIAPFVRNIANPTLRDQASRLTRPYPMGGAFSEAVMNGIEHGSDFCQRGEVAIDLQSNEKGFLFSVTDPGKGISLEQIQKSQVGIDGVRGNGLVSLKRAPAIVTPEALSEGFRVSMLYVL